MTLHEAIEKVLLKKGRSMTTSEIAYELNKNYWYKKKDGSEIQAFQVHGRTRKYSRIFERNGSTVSLIGKSNSKLSAPEKRIIKKAKSKKTKIEADIALFEKALMKEINFKSAAIIDDLVPDVTGFYCIMIKESHKIPKSFSNILTSRKHNILYIGIASQSLKKRFLNQELRARGHGTFFRSIGAILGYRPEKGSLSHKANKRNYTFQREHEKEIIDWINKNLKVNWVPFQGNYRTIETGLIEKHLPLLNIAKNPLSLKELSELRAECVRIANS